VALNFGVVFTLWFFRSDLAGLQELELLMIVNCIVGLLMGAVVTDRKQAEEDLQVLKAELEQRVIQRTAQLEAANKEMETFSYSVSHDLRAPLRGIDGWSQALLEDYGGQLDAQGQTYLNRVRSETQRMGLLIDEMLQLSRLMRVKKHTEWVDLSVIAQTIAARLQESAPERPVEFTIPIGLGVKGDSELLEIALSNLLSNAFKFTGKTQQACIEFGLTESQGQPIFFVRDNGAGFDMAYVQKLFGAFQRLHKVSDFPGTGIGLATVQRIIHRHGGRVWAEGQVNKGATFYFTLEEAE
jgi:light-regulated signal transduction histidine kinase (bacteriophytochrome)